MKSVTSASADGINMRFRCFLLPFADANGTDSAAPAFILAHHPSIQTIGTGEDSFAPPAIANGVTSPLSVSISNNLSGASPATINLADDLIKKFAFSEKV